MYRCFIEFVYFSRQLRKQNLHLIYALDIIVTSNSTIIIVYSGVMFRLFCTFKFRVDE